MSRKAKGIDTDKLLEQIARADIDDQISFFNKFKSQLSALLFDRAAEKEEEASKLAEKAQEILSPKMCDKPKTN
jgi:hypothetical protein